MLLNTKQPVKQGPMKNFGETIRDLRVAEVVEQDVHIDAGGQLTFRTKLRVSFKYEDK